MEPYQEMYYRLFNAATKAIELLREVQIVTEEIFMSAAISTTSGEANSFMEMQQHK